MNWQCRIGWHRWYLDAALLARAERCDRCHRYANDRDGERLARERAALVAAPRDASIADLYAVAFRANG